MEQLLTPVTYIVETVTIPGDSKQYTGRLVYNDIIIESKYAFEIGKRIPQMTFDDVTLYGVLPLSTRYYSDIKLYHSTCCIDHHTTHKKW
jgi:hypothetical protein